jgi:Yip1 domain
MAMAMDRSLPNRMIRAVQLDAQLYEEVEHDRSANVQAVLVVTLAGISAGIATFILDGIGAAIAVIIGALIGWLFWSALTYFVGKTFFSTAETQVDFGEMSRVLGFSNTIGILGFLGFIPYLGGFVLFAIAIWKLVCGVIAVRQALDVDTGRAIGTVLVGWLIEFVLSFILYVALPATV